jgi:serine protease
VRTLYGTNIDVMHKIIFSSILTLFLIGYCFIAQAQILDHFQGQLLVKTEYPIERILQFYEKFEGQVTRLELKRKVAPVFNIYLLEFDYANIHEEKLLRALRNNPMVHTAQYNHLISHRAVPNDTQFDNQWQYINTGQSGGTAGADLDAELAWDITTGGVTALGDTIVAAIIDDGFDWTHEDFEDNIWVNYHEVPDDGIDNDSNGYIDDYRGWNAYDESDNIGGGGHGTPVTGIIGAKGNNGLGVAGVNWDVKLMIIQGGGGEADALAAYAYCYALRKQYNETSGQLGAYVVTTNSSWGVDYGQASEAPLWCAFYDTLGIQGIVSCGATINGNENVDVVGDLPTTCTSDYLISVTNMNRFDQKVTGAGYGATSIDLGAFGADTWTADFGNSYGGFGGTSGATPHVAGTVALMHSVPCPSFAAAAKQDPAGTALLIKQYILNTVDSNNSLQGITTSEGRLNIHNAVNAILANCDPNGCFVPYTVTNQNTIDISTEISWEVGADTDQSNLRYREVGVAVWIDVENIASPYTLSGLQGCTDYEYQLVAVCDGNETDWTSSFLLETDGCCEAPSNLTTSNTGLTELSLVWNDVLVAESYDLRYRAVDDSDWIEENTTATSLLLGDLEVCTTYEIQIRTNCQEGTTTAYSDSYFYATVGCGACIDADYCSSNAAQADFEWIESVELNTINNVSGSDEGYGNHTNFSTDLTVDESYDIILTPGFADGAFSEYFTVWIDYNQDGDFDDDGEIAYDPGETTQSFITGSITIPTDALAGATRMRVSQRWNNPAAPCDVDYDYGEVEDYCVNIISDNIPTCATPINIELGDTSNTSMEINWDNVVGAVGYEIRYKVVGSATWQTNSLSTNMVLLTELGFCTMYDVGIKAICAGSESDFSITGIFSTTCSSSTNDLNKISFLLQPNPVADELTVILADEKDWTLSIMDTRGRLISSTQFNSNEQTISLGYLPAGIYFVQIEQAGRRGIQKIIKL